MDKPITIAVAIVGSILCLLLPRRYALVPLALSICMYPANMIMPPEGVGLTAQRVIAAILLARCIFSHDIRSTFKWGSADWIAAGYFALLAISQTLSQGIDKAAVNRGGFFLSAMAPFWCVRFLVTDRAALYAFIKGFLWAALPLAVLGMAFMLYGYSPYYPLMACDPLFYPMNQRLGDPDQRMFLGAYRYRAHAPFQHCIMFGWFFALWLVPATNLFFQKRRLWPWLVPFLALPLGVVSSVAGGPMMFAAVSFALLAMFPFRRYGKVFLFVAVAGYIFLLIFAKRSPMELLASFGMNAESAFYRVSLQDQILKRGAMTGHWIEGWGEVPGTMGPFHDLCIHWIGVLVYNGVMGLVGFYSLMGIALWSLWKGKDKAQSIEDQWLLWSVMSCVVGSLLAMSIVALFSEMSYIYHMFLALVINMPLIVGSTPTTRQVGIVAQMGDQTVLLRYTLGPDQKLAIVRPANKPE